MRRSTPSMIVTERARSAVRAFLDATKGGDIVLDDLSSVMQPLEQVGDRAIPALAEAMDREDERERLIAAWAILIAAEERRPMATAWLAAKAERLVIGALRDGGDELKMATCGLLTGGGVPKKAVKELAALLEHSVDSIRILAAAALTRVATGEVERVEAVKTLGRALREQDGVLAATAGVALLRMKAQGEWAAEVVADQLLGLRPEIQYHLLNGIADVGPAAACCAAKLRAIVTDGTADALLRGRAAAALGSVLRGNESVEPLLMAALESTEWQVVAGAAEGLTRSGRISIAAVGRLAALLAAEDESLLRGGGGTSVDGEKCGAGDWRAD